ncbi:MAG: hypothetical protein KDA80_12365 [Planctomycetaceae bacterium]|nr:hypothetical protein [Planctomycetaceae bacterium]
MMMRSALILAFLLVWMTCVPATAATVESVVEEYASAIGQFLEEKDQRIVAIDDFDGPRVGTGRSLSTRLKESLQERGFSIDETGLQAEFTVRGSLTQLPDGEFTAVAIDVRVLNSDTNQEEQQVRKRVRLTFEEENQSIESNRGDTAIRAPVGSVLVDDPKDVEQLTAPSFDASEVTSRPEKDKVIQGSLNDPQVSLSDDAEFLEAAKGSPFRIQVLVDRPNAAGEYDEQYEPISLEDRRGLAFAPFQQGDRYAIRIFNDTEFDVGVALEIDGINSLSISQNEEFRKRGLWVVPRKGRGLVKGFHLDNLKVASFLVDTEERQESTIRQLGPASKIGTVSVAFFFAWIEGETVPQFAKNLGTPKDLVTIPGPEIENPSETVERVFCQTSVARITFRYRNPDPALPAQIQPLAERQP